MLAKAAVSRHEDAITPEEEIKDPYVLEFLGLKDEYSESEIEEALILHLERFLLELGGDFAFIGRQRRLRIGDEWYRVDLLFFHRKLRCLVVIDLKRGQVHSCRCGPDAHVPQLRARTLVRRVAAQSGPEHLSGSVRARSPGSQGLAAVRLALSRRDGETG